MYSPSPLSRENRPVFKLNADAFGIVCGAKPKLIVCDEITSALDVSVQASVIETLKQLQETTKVGLLFVTHNLYLFKYNKGDLDNQTPDVGSYFIIYFTNSLSIIIVLNLLILLL